MSKTIIKDKTVESAIRKAVEQFNVVNKDDLEIVVLENGSKGFLGIGRKDAEIEVSVKPREEMDIDLTFNINFDEEVESKSEEQTKKEARDLVKAKKDTKEFLEKVLKAMYIEAQFEFTETDKKLEVAMNTNKDNVLIGKRGKTLESLELLTNLAINKGESKYVNVYLDVADYKRKRRETLNRLANNLAKKVMKTKRYHALEPMNRYERKIIHAALQDHKYVKTYSKGVEPNRHVVIDIKQ